MDIPVLGGIEHSAGQIDDKDVDGIAWGDCPCGLNRV